MNTQEALKMAIEALSEGAYGKEREKAIQACKKALAQPQPKLFLDLSNSNGNHPVQQEPVAWIDEANNTITTVQLMKYGWLGSDDRAIPDAWIKLYTHPAPSWQGLSDDVVMQTYLFIFNDDESEPDEQVIQFYKLIDQELKTKNGFSDVKEKNHG